MGLTVITPPVSELLVSEQTIKDELGLTTNDQDSYLQRLIRRVSSALVDYCGRPFAKQTVREVLVGTDTERLMVSLTPVLALVGNVTDADGAVLAGVTIEDAEAGFLARTAGWPSSGGLRTPLAGDPIPGTERPSITITYTGGYVLETFHQGPATLPGELEELVVEMVCDRYQASRGGDGGTRRDRAVTQERLGDWSASYSHALAASIPARLARWRRLC